MATIKKRNNSYLIRVSNGFDVNGKQIFINTTYKPTATTPKAIEKEVRDFANAFEKTVKAGKYLEGEKITFSKFVENWRSEWAITHLTQSQIEQYEDTLKRHVYDYIGNMKIAKIPATACQKIITDMVNQGYASKTVHRVFTAFNSIFKYAYRMNVIHENPCMRCELPKLEQDTELHYFTPEQVKIFLNALTLNYPVKHKAHSRKNVKTGIDEPVKEFEQYVSIPFQWRVYFSLAIFGGFRRGELIALTWKDIDFDNRTVSINKAVAVTKKYGEMLKKPKTLSGIRTVTLPDMCFDLLREWKEKEIELCKQLGTAWQGEKLNKFADTWVFITAEGKRMYIDSPTQRFKAVLDLYNGMIDNSILQCKTAEERNALALMKLPYIRLHDLRHTTATLLISEGVDIETVSHRLGHSKASITLDIYGHAMPNKDKQASDILGRIFENAGQTAERYEGIVN